MAAASGCGSEPQPPGPEVEETAEVSTGPPPAATPGGMVWVPGGSFLMGSNNFYPEERPVRPESVAGF